MNCRGMGNLAKRRDVFHFLRNKNYSVYCLQDVHFDKDMEHLVRCEWVLSVSSVLLGIFPGELLFSLIIFLSIKLRESKVMTVIC